MRGQSDVGTHKCHSHKLQIAGRVQFGLWLSAPDSGPMTKYNVVAAACAHTHNSSTHPQQLLVVWRASHWFNRLLTTTDKKFFDQPQQSHTANLEAQIRRIINIESCITLSLAVLYLSLSSPPSPAAMTRVLPKLLNSTLQLACKWRRLALSRQAHIVHGPIT